MADSNGEKIKTLREKLYYALQGQAGPKIVFGSYNSLPPKFDQELLNDVARLKSLSGDELKEAVANIRGKLLICQTTGFVGDNDCESFNRMLDDIEQNN